MGQFTLPFAVSVTSEPLLKKVALVVLAIIGVTYSSIALARSVQSSKNPLVKISTVSVSSITVPNLVLCAQDDLLVQMNVGSITCNYISKAGVKTSCLPAVKTLSQFKFVDGPEVLRQCALLSFQGSIKLNSVHDYVHIKFETQGNAVNGNLPIASTIYFGLFTAGTELSKVRTSITTMGLGFINLEPNSYTTIGGDTTYGFDSTVGSAAPFPGVISGSGTGPGIIILGAQNMKMTEQTEVSDFTSQDVLTSILSVFGALSSVWAFLAGPGEHKKTGFIYDTLEWLQLRASPDATPTSEAASGSASGTGTGSGGGAATGMAFPSDSSAVHMSQSFPADSHAAKVNTSEVGGRQVENLQLVSSFSSSSSV
jgi:hypothetical protein